MGPMSTLVGFIEFVKPRKGHKSPSRERFQSFIIIAFVGFLTSLVEGSPINRQAGISENVYITVQNDTYGIERRVCSIDDMTYEHGESIPTSSPCEHCICRPPGFACTIISCEYRPGCKALKRSDQCCPEYQCECEKNGKIYQNGAKILDDNNPCEVCYCQGGDVICTVIDCYWRSDCQPRYIENRCCPLYHNCPPPSEQGPIRSTQRPMNISTTTFSNPISWFNMSSAIYATPSTTEKPESTLPTQTVEPKSTEVPETDMSHQSYPTSLHESITQVSDSSQSPEIKSEEEHIFPETSSHVPLETSESITETVVLSSSASPSNSPVSEGSGTANISLPVSMEEVVKTDVTASSGISAENAILSKEHENLEPENKIKEPGTGSTPMGISPSPQVPSLISPDIPSHVEVNTEEKPKISVSDDVEIPESIQESDSDTAEPSVEVSHPGYLPAHQDSQNISGIDQEGANGKVNLTDASMQNPSEVGPSQAKEELTNSENIPSTSASPPEESMPVVSDIPILDESLKNDEDQSEGTVSPASVDADTSIPETIPSKKIASENAILSETNPNFVSKSESSSIAPEFGPTSFENDLHGDGMMQVTDKLSDLNQLQAHLHTKLEPQLPLEISIAQPSPVDSIHSSKAPNEESILPAEPERLEDAGEIISQIKVDGTTPSSLISSSVPSTKVVLEQSSTPGAVVESIKVSEPELIMVMPEELTQPPEELGGSEAVTLPAAAPEDIPINIKLSRPQKISVPESIENTLNSEEVVLPEISAEKSEGEEGAQNSNTPSLVSTASEISIGSNPTSTALPETTEGSGNTQIPLNEQSFLNPEAESGTLDIIETTLEPDMAHEVEIKSEEGSGVPIPSQYMEPPTQEFHGGSNPIQEEIIPIDEISVTLAPPKEDAPGVEAGSDAKAPNTTDTVQNRETMKEGVIFEHELQDALESQSLLSHEHTPVIVVDMDTGLTVKPETSETRVKTQEAFELVTESIEYVDPTSAVPVDDMSINFEANGGTEETSPPSASNSSVLELKTVNALPELEIMASHPGGSNSKDAVVNLVESNSAALPENQDLSSNEPENENKEVALTGVSDTTTSSTRNDESVDSNTEQTILLSDDVPVFDEHFNEPHNPSHEDTTIQPVNIFEDGAGINVKTEDLETTPSTVVEKDDKAVAEALDAEPIPNDHEFHPHPTVQNSVASPSESLDNQAEEEIEVEIRRGDPELTNNPYPADEHPETTVSPAEEKFRFDLSIFSDDEGETNESKTDIIGENHGTETSSKLDHHVVSQVKKEVPVQSQSNKLAVGVEDEAVATVSSLQRHHLPGHIDESIIEDETTTPPLQSHHLPGHIDESAVEDQTTTSPLQRHHLPGHIDESAVEDQTTTSPLQRHHLPSHIDEFSVEDETTTTPLQRHHLPGHVDESAVEDQTTTSPLQRHHLPGHIDESAVEDQTTTSPLQRHHLPGHIDESAVEDQTTTSPLQRHHLPSHIDEFSVEDETTTTPLQRHHLPGHVDESAVEDQTTTSPLQRHHLPGHVDESFVEEQTTTSPLQRHHLPGHTDESIIENETDSPLQRHHLPGHTDESVVENETDSPLQRHHLPGHTDESIIENETDSPLQRHHLPGHTDESVVENETDSPLQRHHLPGHTDESIIENETDSPLQRHHLPGHTGESIVENETDSPLQRHHLPGHTDESFVEDETTTLRLQRHDLLEHIDNSFTELVGDIGTTEGTTYDFIEPEVKTEESTPRFHLPVELVKQVNPISDDFNSEISKSDLRRDADNEVSSVDSTWFWRTFDRVRSLFPSTPQKSFRKPRSLSNSGQETNPTVEVKYWGLPRLLLW